MRGEAPAPTASEQAEDPTSFGTVIRARDFAGERPGAVELLLQAPGTRVRRAPGGSTFALRGSSADQTLVLLDGIRLNALAGGGVELRTLPVGLLDRITVVRGVSGARWGSGALGGVALITTRRPTAGGVEGALTLTGGSFGTYGLDASISGGGERFQGIAAISLDASEGDFPVRYDPTPSFDPSDVRIERLQNNDSKSAGLLLKGAGRFGAVRLQAMAQGFAAERGLPGTLYWRDTQRREDRRVVVALRAEPAERGDHAIEGGLELRHDELAIHSGSDRGVLELPEGDGRKWQVENAFDAVMAAESAPVPWTFVRLEGRAGGEWISGPFFDDHARERLSLSLLDELYLGEAVTVAPGLRFDRIGAYDGLSPKLGVSVRPLEGLELRANAAGTFRAPSLGELHFEQGPIKPNPDLRPEHGYGVDAGAAWRGKRAALQASAFHARTSDMIVYELATNGLTKPFNFLDAEVNGGEVEGSVEPLRRLVLTASLGVARTRNLRDDPRFLDKELPFRPAWRGLARIAWRGADTEAFAEGSRQSSQYVNRSNTSSLPAQTSLRGGVGARLWRGPSDYDVWLAARIENALDAELVDQLGFPQPGRAFFVTLRVVPFGRSDGQS
ncbi:MAG TPA: TonB-dependent receptor [Vulgatibacter sp.]|nr:TonB-dependent receptor [Vulgatibacter sp.]